MSESIESSGLTREDTILAYAAMAVLVAAIGFVVAVTLTT